MIHKDILELKYIYHKLHLKIPFNKWVKDNYTETTKGLYTQKDV